MNSSEPTFTAATSSLGGNNLNSPTLSGKNTGMLDDKSFESGVEKLMQEFQEVYAENKETLYGIPKDTSTTSPNTSDDTVDNVS
jgi:hypothetical protein